MNVVSHKILGTLDDQVRGRTTLGNTPFVSPEVNRVLRKNSLRPLLRYDAQRISLSLFTALCQDLFRKPREQDRVHYAASVPVVMILL